ncbi:unnamed protein product [Paramecium octaurelia]|uniref:WD40-repeat-containing domain n=1 Tax=Paramecium octaurelia TaxID=43137 RepID=A0A8S1Y004_PAROT|nr:unnamed protein product [Paramecium octaurelia]
MNLSKTQEIFYGFEQFESFIERLLNQFENMRQELFNGIIDLINVFRKQKNTISEIKEKYSQQSSNKHLNKIYLSCKVVQEQQLKKFLNQMQKFQETLSSIYKSDSIWLDELFNEELMNVRLVLMDDTMSQNEACFAIALNQPGTIMASGSENQIKMWNFNNGNIKQITTLSTHQMLIFCLIFSNKCNSFLSGSNDSISMWQTKDDQSWENVNTIQIGAYCMILNTNEAKLYIGGQESISVSDINFEKKKLDIMWILPVKQAYCISLNEDETFLVACSNDKQIRIWQIQQHSIYEHQIIDTNQDGHKICFLTNTQFIWLPKEQYQQNSVYVYELQEGEFQHQKDKMIPLQTDAKCYDCLFFPIIFNQGRKMFAVRHKYYLYLLKICSNGKFKIVTQKEFLTDEIYGTMTKDGNNLVLWDEISKKYQIYEIEIS